MGQITEMFSGTRRPSRRDAALSSERRLRAVEMALAGKSYDQIAETLGYANRSGAWKAVQRALHDREVLGADELRELELQRLEALHCANWGAALSGDLKAANVVLRAADQRIRLLGLDLRSWESTAPRKTIVIGPEETTEGNGRS